ncbi:ParB/RepB/Spo0J family partition protein [Paraburkholderia eburnea]|uniref:ParB/RepB/Spo0J family partition protein n=1 Tax=Paraburkholderia eburnea TaxID=1189126 RepID=A0A2S4MDG8_9BURK|nr:ParB/RepB/Spo0J family partition protein [Paraburkholderia eburnea]POR52798.1 ParB/RepB/Spo0J family partition protein [Paraburkholderia eburnea]PRZ23666.1 ParB/RepB/Spo0J family partition protein [Paraburkholderia eburnea]
MQSNEQASVEFLPIDSIRKSPTNPRKRFPESEHLELVASVREHGILQPVLVRPWPDESGLFELVAGERRLRAAVDALLADVPVLVRSLSDDEVLQIQIVENLQRRDLHPLEEADGYKALADRGHPLDQIASEVTQTRSYVAARLKLCALTDRVRKLFFDGQLTAATALIVARMPADLQDAAAKEISTPDWQGDVMSARAASAHVQRTYMLRLDQADFKTSDAELVPGVGACGPCPKRTGNQEDLFGDVKSKDLCTDPACFALKKEAGAAQARAAAEADGRKVITGKEAKAVSPHQYSALTGGWVKLDDRCEGDPKGRSYRQVIGAKAVRSAALLEEPHAGKLVDVMQRADLKKALADKGIQVRSTAQSNPAQSAENAKKKAADAYRGALFQQIREKHVETGLDDFDLKIVAVTFYRRLWNENQKRISKLYGWGSTAISEADFAKKVDEFEKNDPVALARLVMDIALIDESVAPSYQTGKPELLEATARVRGIDPAAVRKQVESDMKPKPKEKPVPVTKVPATSAKPPAKAAPAKKAPAVKKTAAKPRTAVSTPVEQPDSAKPTLKRSAKSKEPWPFPNTGHP